MAAGIAVARAVRGATGVGDGKVALLGWSRGATIAYAYANAEAAMPEATRQVGALIPVEIRRAGLYFSAARAHCLR